MSAILLDTSAYSFFKRGHEDAVRTIRQARGILLPTVVLGELLAGFDVGRQSERNRRELEAFVGSSRVTLVPVTGESAERYARIYVYLRRVGRPVPTNDLWIAACAMEHGAALLTADGNFEQMPQIVVQLLEA